MARGRFAIVSDSCADLPREVYERHDVRVVPLHVVGCGHDWRDGMDITPDEYLDLLATDPAELPRSSQPAIGDFLATYRALKAEGYDDILSLHLPEAVSGTLATARLAAEQVAAEGINVLTIDVFAATIGQGVMVLTAALARDEGLSLDEAADRVDAIRRTGRFYFVPDSLDNLVKGGRLSRLAGMATSLLNIKVIIGTTEECSMEVAGKVRGMRSAIKRMGKLMRERAGEVGELAYVQLDAHTLPETAAAVRQELAGVGGLRLGLATIGPVIATHIGVHATGVWSFARDALDPRLPEVLSTFLKA